MSKSMRHNSLESRVHGEHRDHIGEIYARSHTIEIEGIQELLAHAESVLIDFEEDFNTVKENFELAASYEAHNGRPSGEPSTSYVRAEALLLAYNDLHSDLSKSMERLQKRQRGEPLHVEIIGEGRRPSKAKKHNLYIVR